MGDKIFQTDLEIALQEALEERGIYFSLINKDLASKFRENKLAQYPEPPAPTEGVDEEFEFLPEEVKGYKEGKEKEHEKAYSEWEKEVGIGGVMVWKDKAQEEFFRELEDLAADKGVDLPFKISTVGIYKWRTAEIERYVISYAVICDVTKPEGTYAGELPMMEAVCLDKIIGKRKREIISVKFEKNQKYEKTIIGEHAREVIGDIGQLRVLRRKYDHREKVDPREVVEDIMKLIES